MGGLLLGGLNAQGKLQSCLPWKEKRNPREDIQEVLPLVWVSLPSLGEGGWLPFSIVLVSSDGVEDAAWHQHPGSPVEGGPCISFLGAYV